jgi:hypothetical protein
VSEANAWVSEANQQTFIARRRTFDNKKLNYYAAAGHLAQPAASDKFLSKEDQCNPSTSSYLRR